MSISLLRLDLTRIFGAVDDFYAAFEAACQQLPPLPWGGAAQPYRSQLSLSEVMTTAIAFHGSGFRTFKDFCTCQMLPHWRQCPWRIPRAARTNGTARPEAYASQTGR